MKSFQSYQDEMFSNFQGGFADLVELLVRVGEDSKRGLQATEEDRDCYQAVVDPVPVIYYIEI